MDICAYRPLKNTEQSEGRYSRFGGVLPFPGGSDVESETPNLLGIRGEGGPRRRLNVLPTDLKTNRRRKFYV
jgi:hypothetical protein